VSKVKYVACTFVLLTAVWSGASVADEAQVLSLGQSYAEAAANSDLWPGFDPLTIPLVVFDGTDTYAFGHPTPPEGFLPLGKTQPTVYKFPGRHPKVVANSSATIGNVSCATLDYGNEAVLGSIPLSKVTATAIHEAFHVYQRRKHTSWMGNDMDLFLYPVDDAQLLVWRRLETEYLRRACEAGNDDAAVINIRLAIFVREKRFSAMSNKFSAYERGTELNEGLATYVEFRVLGRKIPELPEGGYESEDVRLRCYQSGLAFGLLLDRFEPNWRNDLEQKDDTSLTELLIGAVGRADVSASEISGPELEAIAKAATTETAGLRQQWTDRRLEYLGLPGWSLVIETAPDAPLQPVGFDPWNVKRAEGSVLHTRFLKLKNSQGHLELLGGTALTEGAGAHPIFNGIRRFVLTGMKDKPELSIIGGMTKVSAPAFEGEFKVKEVECHDKRVVLRLSGVK